MQPPLQDAAGELTPEKLLKAKEQTQERLQAMQEDVEDPSRTMNCAPSSGGRDLGFQSFCFGLAPILGILSAGRFGLGPRWECVREL